MQENVNVNCPTGVGDFHDKHGGIIKGAQPLDFIHHTVARAFHQLLTQHRCCRRLVIVRTRVVLRKPVRSAEPRFAAAREIRKRKFFLTIVVRTPIRFRSFRRRFRNRHCMGIQE